MVGKGEGGGGLGNVSRYIYRYLLSEDESMRAVLAVLGDFGAGALLPNVGVGLEQRLFGNSKGVTVLGLQDGVKVGENLVAVEESVAGIVVQNGHEGHGAVVLDAQ